MNWRRIKLFLIVCLLGVNVLLGVFCAKIIIDKAIIPDDEIKYAVKNLSDNGLAISENVITKVKRNPAICEIMPDRYDDLRIFVLTEFARAAFGIEANTDEIVKTPEGCGITLHDADGKVVGSGAYYDNLEIVCCFDYASLLLKDAYALKYKDAGERKHRSIRVCDDFTENIVKKLYGSQASFECTGIFEMTGYSLARYELVVDGFCVPELYLSILEENGQIVGISGRFMCVAPEKAYSAKILDAVNMLYRFSEKHTGTVNELRLGYSLTEKPDGGYYFIPAWIIDYNDENGENHIFVRDAVTGETEKEIA